MYDVPDNVGLALLLVGAPLLATNIGLAFRAALFPARRFVSGVALVAGVAVALAMLCFAASRRWAWLPLALDPGGPLAFTVALLRQRRGAR